jgi:hypothetical protein
MLARLAPLALFSLLAPLTMAACEIQPTTLGGGSTNTGSTSQFCAAACTADAKCDGSVLLASCENACASRYGTRLAHARTEWVSAASSCFASASCSSWLTGAALTSCQDQATASVTATATAKTYCQKAVAKDTACGVGGGESEGACQDLVKTIDDTSLNAAIGCLSGDCASYATCVRNATGT